ncbi:MAG: hypothetical protein ACE5IY_14015 [bacterium]
MDDKMTYEELLQEYEDLQQIHHQALHEMADAAQIIKSYEFLQEVYDRENKMLRRIVTLAEDMCTADEFASFVRKRARLQQAIYEFRAHVEKHSCSDRCELTTVSPSWVVKRNPMSVN